MRAFFRHLRGVAIFSGFVVNTLLCFTPLLVLAVIKLFMPIPVIRRGITRVLMQIGETWVAVNSAILTMAGSIDWRATGLENLRRDEWYLVIVNHVSAVDILVVQKVFNRRIPFLKFFIKQELVWVPILGVAWWALDMPFMKRYSPKYLAKNPHMKGRDLKTTRRACKKFRYTPTSVINFVEGTRFTVSKRDSRNSPYRHLLQPRAGGFSVAMSSMGELFGSILDVTLVYPGGAATFWDMCCGKHIEVLVDVRERKIEEWLIDGDYQNDREYRRRVHTWFGEIWQDKDELIQQMLTTRESHD
ncbi:MAG: acyltransferase [Gammaproteobacteria bacterium]|jgi:1-acyl-sn-glycerol-3-phosphate acyltransferase|nr:acyltransferase [Gammaproteobacteria bacterium]